MIEYCILGPGSTHPLFWVKKYGVLPQGSITLPPPDNGMIVVLHTFFLHFYKLLFKVFPN